MNLALPKMVVLNGTVFELDKYTKEYNAVNYITTYSKFKENQNLADEISVVSSEETEKMEAIAKINEIANDNHMYYINCVIEYVYNNRPWIWAVFYGKDEWFKLVKKEACAIQAIEFSVRNDYDDSESEEINEKELNDLVREKIYKYLDKKLPKSPTIYRRLRIKPADNDGYISGDEDYNCCVFKEQPELYVISLTELFNEGDIDSIMARDVDYLDMSYGYDRPDIYLENMCGEINMDFDYDKKYDDSKYLF